jgi:hypothetical protein
VCDCCLALNEQFLAISSCIRWEHIRCVLYNRKNFPVLSSFMTYHLATVSLKVVSRKHRRKCTLKSYDCFTKRASNIYWLLHLINVHIKKKKQIVILLFKNRFTIYDLRVPSTTLNFAITFWLNFKKTTISGACTNNGSKIKLSTNKEHITFPWIWGLTGYHFCTEKDQHIKQQKYTSYNIKP